MARIIETKDDNAVEIYTKDSLTGKTKRVAEFSPNAGGLIIGSAGIDGVSGNESDNIKIHRSGSGVVQLVLGSDTTPDGIPAPSSYFAKLNGVIGYNATVGSAAQLAAGECTHDHLSGAISGLSDGDKVLVIGKTEDSTTVTVSNRLKIEGIGNESEISSALILASGSGKSLIKFVKYGVSLLINNGSNNNIITDCWIINGGTVTDNNDSPNNLITILEEE